MDRYDIQTYGDPTYMTYEVHPYGAWVKYSDVEALQARVRELEEALPYLRDLARCTNPYRAVEVIDKLMKGTHNER